MKNLKENILKFKEHDLEISGNTSLIIELIMCLRESNIELSTTLNDIVFQMESDIKNQFDMEEDDWEFEKCLELINNASKLHKPSQATRHSVGEKFYVPRELSNTLLKGTLFPFGTAEILEVLQDSYILLLVCKSESFDAELPLEIGFDDFDKLNLQQIKPLWQKTSPIDDISSMKNSLKDELKVSKNDKLERHPSKSFSNKGQAVYSIGSIFTTGVDLQFKDFLIPKGTLAEVIQEVGNDSYELYFFCIHDLDHIETVQVFDLDDFDRFKLSPIEHPESISIMIEEFIDTKDQAISFDCEFTCKYDLEFQEKIFNHFDKEYTKIPLSFFITKKDLFEFFTHKGYNIVDVLRIAINDKSSSMYEKKFSTNVSNWDFTCELYKYCKSKNRISFECSNNSFANAFDILSSTVDDKFKLFKILQSGYNNCGLKETSELIQYYLNRND